MKISKYLGTFALLAMLAACSTEDEQVRFAGDEVKVNATIGGESVLPEVILWELRMSKSYLMTMTKLELV